MNGWRPLAMNEANENVVFHSLMNLRCKNYIGLMLQWLAQWLVEETLVALFYIKFFNCNLLADNIIIIR